MDPRLTYKHPRLALPMLLPPSPIQMNRIARVVTHTRMPQIAAKARVMQTAEMRSNTLHTSQMIPFSATRPARWPKQPVSKSSLVCYDLLPP